MRILITNDDSISAEQLMPLARYCRKFGEVTVAVPKHEQSAKSHGINIHHPFEVTKQTDDEITVYTVDSTPADCVRFAVLGLKLKFDLIISGINRGFNMGTDMLYSGTVSAVREAGILGLPAIALSTCPEYYDKAINHLDIVFDYISQHKLLDIHSLYNINIPPKSSEVKITRQGGVYFSDTFVEAGENMYQASGICAYQNRNDLTLDTDAVMSGYISITPITINMTDRKIFEKLVNNQYNKSIPLHKGCSYFWYQNFQRKKTDPAGSVFCLC